ncbi:MAG TPA: sigma-70 family RNA polymerase sigma factor [Aquihabitans sp.]|jgi:RNA polymerase sigma factor (sigma-70 family)|nr:sigma-70 family RNA polymerase sigma factor [Aquihabitans sp.]
MRIDVGDDQLIDLVRSGDEAAYGELYRRHQSAVHRFAQRLTGSRSAADDVVSEAFTKVLSAIRRGHGPRDAFRPYLYSAVKNTANDLNTKRRRNEPVEPGEMEALSESVHLLDGADNELVIEAFTRLPERWRAVLWYVEAEQMSPAAVAPILGLSPNAVSALAYRAREALRESYLNVHLQLQLPDACRPTAKLLGGYVRGNLTERQLGKVEHHVADCQRCTEALLELDDVAASFRAVVGPLLLLGPARLGWLRLRRGDGHGRAVRHPVAVAAMAAVTAALVVVVATSGLRAAFLPEEGQRSVRETPGAGAGAVAGGGAPTSGSAAVTDPSTASTPTRGQPTTAAPTTTAAPSTTAPPASDPAPTDPGAPPRTAGRATITPLDGTTTGPQPVGMVITNTGAVPLGDVEVADRTQSGALQGLSCDFSPLGGPSAGTNWRGPLAAGASFRCRGTLTLTPGSMHVDTGSVTGTPLHPVTGEPLGVPKVDDEDPFHAETPPGKGIDVEKFDGAFGSPNRYDPRAVGRDQDADGDRADRPVPYQPGRARTIRIAIANTGTEPLVDLVVSDRTTAGSGTMTDLSCDFSPVGGPPSGTTWAGPLEAGEHVYCTGSLTLALGDRHTNTATVTATGRDSGTRYRDQDDLHARTPRSAAAATDADRSWPARVAASLPETGAAVTTAAAVGLALLAAGAVLVRLRRTARPPAGRFTRPAGVAGGARR